MIDFHPFGLLRVTEAEMMLSGSSEALYSLRVPPCQLHCYCTAVSAPLCKTGTGRVSFLRDAPSRFPEALDQRRWPLELGKGLGISDSIHHMVAELCLLRPLF